MKYGTSVLECRGHSFRLCRLYISHYGKNTVDGEILYTTTGEWRLHPGNYVIIKGSVTSSSEIMLRGSMASVVVVIQFRLEQISWCDLSGIPVGGSKVEWRRILFVLMLNVAISVLSLQDSCQSKNDYARKILTKIVPYCKDINGTEFISSNVHSFTCLQMYFDSALYIILVPFYLKTIINLF